MSDSIFTTIDRYAVIRTDRYELPSVAFVTESEVHPGEDAEYFELEVEVSCWGYFTPGRYSGPPEDCYPDEGDFEIQDVELVDGPDWPFTLTAAEERRVEEKFSARESEEPDYPDYEPDSYPEDDGYMDYIESGVY